MAVGTGTIEPSGSARNGAHVSHGVVISIAVILWFPLGVFLLRLLKSKNTLRLHAAWQTVGLLLLVVGFGLGVWLSHVQGGLIKKGHSILGIVITALFLLEPLTGWLHHRHFVAAGSKNYKRHIHVWMGRILFVLSVINGGTGFSLAKNSTTGSIVYGVIAGVMVVTYLLVWWLYKKQQRNTTVKSDGNAVPLENAGS